ncbi:MAG: succinylglutamate desuccinylase/aspartoacylase family protein [Kordiimonadaceae bacterium]|nr:succinylglutamate desuccinylase/aspartoacylase family protein [Kordiimonadaceae bacterium]
MLRKLLQSMFAVLLGQYLSLGSIALPQSETGPDAGYVATGDVQAGIAVIRSLDVDNLPAGRFHFYFHAGWKATGQKFYVPVMVLKGEKPGKRLMITAAVHGDELNGIAVIHQLFAQVAPNDLTGTLIGVPGINQPGLQAGNRHYVGSGGSTMVDPNRQFPGKKTGGDAASLYVGNLWYHLLKDNADLAIDLHTQTRGTAYPLFVFADFSNSTAQQMAYGLLPDMIKQDPGQKGTLETAFVSAGIPAVTFELGEAGRWQQTTISRAVDGILNVMRQQKVIAGPVVKPLVAPYVGKHYTNVYSREGGMVHIHVALKDSVKKGQHIATMVDPFGQEVRRYFAPHDGRVLAVAIDPLREAGAMLVRVLR